MNVAAANARPWIYRILLAVAWVPLIYWLLMLFLSLTLAGVAPAWSIPACLLAVAAQSVSLVVVAAKRQSGDLHGATRHIGLQSALAILATAVFILATWK